MQRGRNTRQAQNNLVAAYDGSMQDLHNARTVIDGFRSSLPFLLQHSERSLEGEVRHLWPETLIVDALTVADVTPEDDELDVQVPSVPYEDLFPDDADFRMTSSRTDRPPCR